MLYLEAAVHSRYKEILVYSYSEEKEFIYNFMFHLIFNFYNFHSRLANTYNFLPQLIALSFDNKSQSYPEVDVSNLSSVQQKIISTTRQEFKTQPNFKKYYDGNNEPWCADFVSWVYKESGVSFKNPVSGSWRIPGTYTLRDYLNEEDRLVTDSDHKPQVGDLMLYDNPNSFGQHVNIVIKVHQNGDITTIGGNEPGGIRVKTHKAHTESGFVGYGLLGQTKP